jgi:ATP-dependent Clp protease ATP-binding subunit ClpA
VVVGQERAVKAVSQAILRSRAGLNDAGKPTGVFLFFGPSGTGKTLLAKTLANQLFDNTKGSFLRLDMSEYREEHSVSKLIGAPPGYVGYEEAGHLTEHLRRKPFSVVLFDEIEKSHPKVSDILLQLFDEGRHHRQRTAAWPTAATPSSSSRRTSAPTACSRRRASPTRSCARKAGRKAVFDAARGFFRPEFLNRIDELVVFEPLSLERRSRRSCKPRGQRVLGEAPGTSTTSRSRSTRAPCKHIAATRPTRRSLARGPLKRFVQREITTYLSHDDRRRPAARPLATCVIGTARADSHAGRLGRAPRMPSATTSTTPRTSMATAASTMASS